MVRWVARLTCTHDVGAHTSYAPSAGDHTWCSTCEASQEVIRVVTDTPERDHAGRI